MIIGNYQPRRIGANGIKRDLGCVGDAYTSMFVGKGQDKCLLRKTKVNSCDISTVERHGFHLTTVKRK